MRTDLYLQVKNVDYQGWDGGVLMHDGFEITNGVEDPYLYFIKRTDLPFEPQIGWETTLLPKNAHGGTITKVVMDIGGFIRVFIEADFLISTLIEKKELADSGWQEVEDWHFGFYDLGASIRAKQK